MQRRASRIPGPAKASVGQASRQAVQVPQCWAVVRRVGSKGDIEQQSAEKEIATQVLVEQHRVLAKPTEAGTAGEIAFQKRRGVHDAPPLAAGRLLLNIGHQAGQDAPT